MCDTDHISTAPLKFHPAGKTCVFWDVEDYPIPDGLDPASFHRTMKEAIKKRGCHGEVSIQAYFGKSSSDELRRKYEDAGFNIEFVPKGGRDAIHLTMILDIVLFAFENPKPVNVILLAKNIEDEDVGDSLCGVYVRGHGVLSSATQPFWCIPCPSSTWFLTCLFDCPIGPSGSSQLEQSLISCGSSQLQ